jgi:LacI family transcriptional regulator
MEVPQVLDMVHGLGSRFLGCLLVSRKRSGDAAADRARGFIQSGKPVLWFDRNDNGFEHAPDGPNLHRCFFDEESAATRAVDHLRERGHRTALYAYGDWSVRQQASWKRRRERLVREEAEVHGMRVVPFGRRASESSSRGMARMLMDAVRKEGATAIVAPRDKVALKLYYELNSAGWRIPEDISMISFDNRPILVSAPITSVDFGFDYLGYAAFHRIFGLVPVKKNRAGDIAARPRVEDRGSVAALRG